MDQSEVEKELSRLSDAILTTPNDPALYVERAAICSSIHPYKWAEKIIDDLTRALELQDDAQVHCLRGKAYLARGYLGEAKSDFAVAEILSPNNAEVAYWMGLYAWEAHDYKESLTFFSRALELDPTSDKFRWRRAQAAMRAEDAITAMAEYDRLIELEPSLSCYHYDRAYCHLYFYRPGDVAGVVPDLNRAIELDPDAECAYRDRGIVRLCMREWQGAASDLEQFINKPFHESWVFTLHYAHIWLYVTRMMTGKTNLGVEEIESFVHRVDKLPNCQSSDVFLLEWPWPAVGFILNRISKAELFSLADRHSPFLRGADAGNILRENYTEILQRNCYEAHFFAALPLLATERWSEAREHLMQAQLLGNNNPVKWIARCLASSFF